MSYNNIQTVRGGGTCLIITADPRQNVSKTSYKKTHRTALRKKKTLCAIGRRRGKVGYLCVTVSFWFGLHTESDNGKHCNRVKDSNERSSVFTARVTGKPYGTEYRIMAGQQPGLVLLIEKVFSERKKKPNASWRRSTAFLLGIQNGKMLN